MHNFAQTFVKLCKTAQTTRQMQKFAIIENEKKVFFFITALCLYSRFWQYLLGNLILKFIKTKNMELKIMKN